MIFTLVQNDMHEHLYATHTAQRVCHFNFTNNHNLYTHNIMQAGKVEIEAVAIVGEIQDV